MLAKLDDIRLIIMFKKKLHQSPHSAELSLFVIIFLQIVLAAQCQFINYRVRVEGLTWNMWSSE